MHAWLTQDVPREDQRQLLLSVPFVHMSLILQALPGQACMEALLSIGAPLCKDLLLSMPSPTSMKLLHAASTADLAKLIQVSRLPYHRAISVLNLAQVFCVCTAPVSLSFTNLPEHPSTLRNVSLKSGQHGVCDSDSGICFQASARCTVIQSGPYNIRLHTEKSPNWSLPSTAMLLFVTTRLTQDSLFALTH